jgi:hypothetical protein
MLLAAKQMLKKTHTPVRHVHVVTDAPAGKAFFVFGGAVCKNIGELVEALRTMSPSVYEYHTVPRGNDFANWIRDVFEQKRLASRIAKSESQKETIEILESY